MNTRKRNPTPAEVEPGRLGVHRYAETFPEMSAAEYDTLRDDIRAHGLAEPITVHEGKILDGRHRYRACLDLGLDPATEPYRGDDPLGFVVSKNLHRRHLTDRQRAEIAAKMANLPAHRPAKTVSPPTGGLTAPAPVTIAKAAGLLDVSERSVERARARQRGPAAEAAPAPERGTRRRATVELITRADVRRLAAEAAAAPINDGKIRAPGVGPIPLPRITDPRLIAMRDRDEVRDGMLVLRGFRNRYGRHPVFAPLMVEVNAVLDAKPKRPRPAKPAAKPKRPRPAKPAAKPAAEAPAAKPTRARGR
jgi:hypothetical protein